MAAHRSVSDAYDQYSARVDAVGERLAKFVLKERRTTDGERGYSRWHDERTGQRVEIRGGATYSDWDKERTDADLTTVISHKTGTDPDTTRKLIADYQGVASVKGYKSPVLSEHGLSAQNYAVMTKSPRRAVALNAPATVHPNEHTTHAILTHGPAHYADMDAAVDHVEKNWDTFNDDEKMRSYLMLRESAANLRETRDSVVERVAAKVQANPSSTYGKPWGVKTSARPYTKFPDPEGTHTQIRAKIASDHAARTGGDETQARQVLDMYGEAAQFNNPKKAGMSARGLDPDAHSHQVYGRPRIVYQDHTQERAAS